MIFSRIRVREWQRPPLALPLGQSRLDLLQLDLLEAREPRGWAAFKRGLGLASVMPSICSALYLRPELRLVTNASGGSTVATVSSLAESLVSTGNSDMLVTAIRGESLLLDKEPIPSTESLFQRSQVLAARVEIGGGPFATAFAEGARFVVAGTYDVAAPLLGAAVAEGLCGWRDYSVLARLAATAQFSDVVVELRANDAIEIDARAREQLEAVRLRGVVSHADVRVDVSSLALEETPCGAVSPANVRGESSGSIWNGRIVVEAGFKAAALVECQSGKLVALLDRLPGIFDDRSLRCLEYRSAAGAAGELSLVRIEYCEASEDACLEFLVWLQSFLENVATSGRIVAPSPTVERLTKVVSVPVAADAVTIAVDTRPAQEWL